MNGIFTFGGPTAPLECFTLFFVSVKPARTSDLYCVDRYSQVDHLLRLAFQHSFLVRGCAPSSARSGSPIQPVHLLHCRDFPTVLPVRITLLHFASLLFTCPCPYLSAPVNLLHTLVTMLHQRCFVNCSFYTFFTCWSCMLSEGGTPPEG